MVLQQVKPGYYRRKFVLDSHVTDYHCVRHGETKAVVVGGEPFCVLCEQEREASLAEEESQLLAAERERRLTETLRNMNIEPEFRSKDWQDFIPYSEGQSAALEAVQRLVQAGNGKLVLLGPNGTGKTMLGSIAVRHLGGKILTVYEISAMIRQSYSVRADRTELEIVGDLASIPMLVVDELGRSSGSTAELNWLSYILDKRHTRRLPFILISNAHRMRDCPENGCAMCLENYLGNDILSRLRQDTEIITMCAPDYRAGR